MPSVEKIIKKMQNQPNGIKLQEVEKVLNEYGYNKNRQKGSHIIYKNELGEVIGLAIHGKDTIKRDYIEIMLKMIGEED